MLAAPARKEDNARKSSNCILNSSFVATYQSVD